MHLSFLELGSMPASFSVPIEHYKRENPRVKNNSKTRTKNTGLQNTSKHGFLMYLLVQEAANLLISSRQFLSSHKASKEIILNNFIHQICSTVDLILLHLII